MFLMFTSHINMISWGLKEEIKEHLNLFGFCTAFSSKKERRQGNHTHLGCNKTPNNPSLEINKVFLYDTAVLLGPLEILKHMNRFMRVAVRNSL